MVRFIILLVMISLVGCSSSKDVYLEGYVTGRDKKSVDMELLGNVSQSSKNITVKVKDSDILSRVDEGENVLVRCKGVNWWSNPPETEAISLEIISFNERK